MPIARVVEEHKTNYIIADGNETYVATVRGSFFTEHEFPKVGDYVHYSPVVDGKAVIESVEPRRTVIARKSADGRGEQVIVANVDVLFIVMGLDGDFNLSRLERYLLLAEQSAVAPVVVLSKCDLVDDAESYRAEAVAVAGGAPVYVVSAATGENMDVLWQHLTPGVTAVLLGSSGAGKSTITNWLLREDKQLVQAVRSDDSRGRHTTTSRQLFTLPKGGYLIDTPGMRELAVATTAEDEEAVFATLDALSHECRFSNCDHEKSTGCAIMAALSADEITTRQYHSYLKLQRERLFAASKYDTERSFEYKKKQKSLHKSYRQIQKKHRTEKEF